MYIIYIIYVYICIYIYIYIYICIYVTVNLIKSVIMHIPRLLCIISSPIGKSDEKRKFYQIYQIFRFYFA